MIVLFICQEEIKKKIQLSTIDVLDILLKTKNNTPKTQKGCFEKAKIKRKSHTPPTSMIINTTDFISFKQLLDQELLNEENIINID